jgi:hypothetical protein
MRVLAFLIAALALTAADAADSCRATSGATLRPLVELYTSEGCNSCPPADRWLSRHFGAPADSRATALAFHVDYWDRLGWKDRFASAAYTARQHQAMRANRATFVYTPQVLLQGRDFTAWRRGSPENALATAAARPAKATIGISARVAREAVDADVALSLEAAPAHSTFVALGYVDSGLASDVKAGENRGERLRHDHVVRALVTRDLEGPNASFALRVPRPAEAGERAMLVAFVQDAANGEVLQTLELPLEGCR